MKKEICDEEQCGFRIPTEEYPQKDFCRKYKKPIVEIDFCQKRFDGGWISPDGEFHQSGFAEHDADAKKIIQEQFPTLYERMREKYDAVMISEGCKDKLVEKGWIDLTGNPYPCMGITNHTWAVCISENKITPQQHTLINEFIEKGMRFAGFVNPA